MTTGERKTITRQEAADQLGVCLRTVRRYMDRGTLEYERDQRSGRVAIFADSPALRDARDCVAT